MLGFSLSYGTQYGAAADIPPPPPVPTTDTDPAITAIGPEGWRATYTNPVAFDPESDPKFLNVLSAGFDASGQAVQVLRDLRVMARVREPFPNEGTLTSSDVALSEFVYAGDSVIENGSAVTLGSVRPYEAPQAMWLNHDRDRAVTNSHTVRLAVAHAHARKGRPDAAVEFIATDQLGNSISATVSDLSVITYPASGLSVPHFAAVLDLTQLTQSTIVTVDAVIYPWVGKAFRLSTDADPYPSPNLTVLKFLNDRTGAYGTNYAYVDAVAGNDGTGTVSQVAAIAESGPFASVAAAAAAIQVANNANFGRNNTSGGIIRLQDGTHIHSDFSSVAVGETPLMIEPVGTGAVYQDAGASILDGIPPRLKIRGVTLRKAGGSIIFLDNNARAGDDHMLVLEDCVFDANVQSVYDAWIYRVGRLWLINTSGGDCGQVNAFSTANTTAISVGAAGRSVGSAVFHAAGCRDIDAANFIGNARFGDRPAQIGGFLGWCHLGHAASGKRVIDISSAIGARGLALVGNVFEQHGGTIGPVIALSADSVAAEARNVVIMCNTAVGGRSNYLYQDTGSQAFEKSGAFRFNIDLEWNSKDDTFPAGDGGRTGNWAWQYRVGFRTNAALKGATDGKPMGQGNHWLGEIAGLGDAFGIAAVPLNADFADDQSTTGGGAGNGDYTPGPASALPFIPAEKAPYSHDLNGTPVADDGSALIGAVQR